jgi:sporulation protein YabP
MSENTENLKHNLLMENREILEITGVKDVQSFNEEEITAITDWGDLLIKGDKLHVEVLDLQTGDLKIAGNISALVYSDNTPVKGFFKRAFS